MVSYARLMPLVFRESIVVTVTACHRAGRMLDGQHRGSKTTSGQIYNLQPALSSLINAHAHISLINPNIFSGARSSGRVQPDLRDLRSSSLGQPAAVQKDQAYRYQGN